MKLFYLFLRDNDTVPKKTYTARKTEHFSVNKAYTGG